VNGALGDQGGIVDNCVQLAKGSHSKVNQLLSGGLNNKICNQEGGFVCACSRQHRFAQLLLQTMHNHARAFRNAAQRDGLSNASATASDDNDLILQPHLIGILGIRKRARLFPSSHAII
jgi:hypothetical protein